MKKVFLLLLVVIVLIWSLDRSDAKAVTLLLEQNSYFDQYGSPMYMRSEYKRWDGAGNIIEVEGNNDMFFDLFKHDIDFTKYEDIQATLKFQWKDNAYWFDGHDNVDVYLFGKPRPSFSHNVYDGGVPMGSLPWDPYVYVLSASELGLLATSNELSFMLDLIPTEDGWSDSSFYLGLVELSIEGDLAVVPEPSTMLLFGAGIVGLIGTRFRKKRK